MQKTLILIKPDGVKRGLAGEILSRIERTGLKLKALKMTHASRDFMAEHYGSDPEWIKGMGNKTLNNYKNNKIDPVKELGTSNSLEIGKMIFKWLISYMSSGPIVAAVFEGNDAVEKVKKIAGNTLPIYAEPGTIRGDYSSESAALANKEKRAIENLIHISGNLKDAEREVGHWFSELK